jgi:hypothetical protein
MGRAAGATAAPLFALFSGKSDSTSPDAKMQWHRCF